jgi:hypothetical protein
MKVKLIYFKSDTGKYYAEGSYDTKVDDLYDIWDELERRILWLDHQRRCA